MDATRWREVARLLALNTVAYYIPVGRDSKVGYNLRC
jgi:hypothetical protein